MNLINKVEGLSPRFLSSRLRTESYISTRSSKKERSRTIGGLTHWSHFGGVEGSDHPVDFYTKLSKEAAQDRSPARLHKGNSAPGYCADQLSF